MPIFDTVRYALAPSIEADLQRDISNMMNANGAFEVPMDRATHFVTVSINFAGMDELPPTCALVTPYWVERSQILGAMQDPRHYSADPKRLFSGMVATTSGLPPGDQETFIASFESYGGRYTPSYTRATTHLITTNTDSPKYICAIKHQSATGVKIVLPHWWQDCLSAGLRMDEDPYEFPDPIVLRGDPIPKQDDSSETNQMKLYKGLADDGSKSRISEIDPEPHVWKGRNIYLSPSLELTAQNAPIIKREIENGNGHLVSNLNDADILVTRWREGPDYEQALNDHKIIGSLQWARQVGQGGVFIHPNDQLLHYPVPRDKVPHFEKHEITITNYTGAARDYLKALITAMGGKYTATLSPKNTVVLAATVQGQKTDRAREWSLPITNHLWLEDCFVHWDCIPVANPKYLNYPAGVDWSVVLGKKTLGPIEGLKPILADRPFMDHAFHPELAAREDERKTRQPQMQMQMHEMLGGRLTGNSAVEVMEVDEALGDSLPDGTDEDVLMPPFGDRDDGRREWGENVQGTSDVGDNETPPRHHTPSMLGKPGLQFGLDSDGEVSPTKAKASAGLSHTKKPAEFTAGRPPKKPTTPNSDDDEVSPMKAKTNTGPSNTKKPADFTAGRPPQKPTTPTSDDDEVSPTKAKASAGPSNTKKAAEFTAGRPPQRPTTPNERAKNSSKFVTPQKQAPTPPIINKGKNKQQYIDVSDNESDAAVVVKPFKHASPSKAVPIRSPATYKDRDRTRSPAKESRASPQKKFLEKPAELVYHEEEEEEEEEAEPAPAPTKSDKKVTPAPTNKKQQQQPSGDDDDSDVVFLEQSPQRVETKRNPSPKKKLRRLVPQDESDDEDDLDILQSFSRDEKNASSSSPTKIGPPKRKPKSTAPGVTGMKVSQTPISKSSTAIKEIAQSKKVASTSAKGKTTSNPPPATTATASGPKGGKSSKQPAAIQLKATDSGSSAPPNRSESRKSGKRPVTVAREEEEEEEEEESIPNYIQPTVDSQVSERRRSSGRSAATKAGEKLRDNAEDMNIYQQQLKRGVVKGSWENGNERTSTKRVRSESADESEAPNPRDSKKRKVEAGASKKKKPVLSDSGGTESEEIPVKQSINRSAMDPKKVKIATSMVHLDDQDHKVLKNLGVKVTEEPLKCSHLVVPKILRTSKFLCAIAASPFIVHERWIRDCIKEKALLDEKKYLLKDDDGERKFGFKLADSLERAKEYKGRILQGHTFFVTKSVGMDPSVLGDIIKAHGGQISTSTPTARKLAESSLRHVISDPADKGIWLNLATDGVPIYSVELVVMAALLQQLDLNGLRIDDAATA